MIKIEEEIKNGNIKHDLKIRKEYFEMILSGNKKFEIRSSDRNFNIGDSFVLREYDNGIYTGRYFVQVIGYILKDCSQFGLMDGFCIFCW